MKKYIIAIIVVAILLCTGCTKNAEEKTTTEKTSAETTEKSSEETTIEVTTEAETTTTKAEATTPSNTHVDLQAFRSRLTKEHQKIYDEFLAKIRKYEEFIVDFKAVEYDFETFHKIVDAIYDDFPEIRLYLSTDESIREDIYNGEPRFIEVSYEYVWLVEDEFSPEIMDNYLSQMDKVCDEIISRMPSKASKKEQYDFLGREICLRTEYVDKSDSEIPDWAWCYMNGPFLDGEGVCQAYAYAYQYLCHRAGLWCVTVSGDCHCWNIVQLENGDTYHVDLTWADSSIQFEDYFLLTQEEIEFDHIPAEGEWVATGKPLR